MWIAATTFLCDTWRTPFSPPFDHRVPLYEDEALKERIVNNEVSIMPIFHLCTEPFSLFPSRSFFRPHSFFPLSKARTANETRHVSAQLCFISLPSSMRVSVLVMSIFMALGGCQAKVFGSFYECELCNVLPSNC